MSCCSTRKSSAWPLILVVLGIGAVMYMRGRHAPTPAMFDQAVTLDVALEQSEETGKPVFVLATADWCPGCQSLKRGALTDETLASTIKINLQNPLTVLVKSEKFYIRFAPARSR